jgi:hypothetical protein
MKLMLDVETSVKDSYWSIYFIFIGENLYICPGGNNFSGGAMSAHTNMKKVIEYFIEERAEYEEIDISMPEGEKLYALFCQICKENT